MLLLVSLVLCASANGLAVGENKETPSPLVVYKSYADAGRYALVDVPMTWFDASEVCRSFYGHLAFPETAEELALLISIMDNNGTIYHIGFHDQFQDGTYVNMKSQQLSHLNYNLTWAPGQPSVNLTHDCGCLNAAGIYDTDCVLTKFEFICEEDDPLGDGGSLGYEQIGTYGFFKLVENNVIWPEALKTCQNQGSHLWIINSADEYDAVYDHYKPADTRGIWTGVHHVYKNLFFVTIFDEKLETTGYTKWAPGEPSGNNTVYPYVLVTKSGMFVRKSATFFICEYNQPF